MSQSDRWKYLGRLVKPRKGNSKQPCEIFHVINSVLLSSDELLSLEQLRTDENGKLIWPKAPVFTGQDVNSKQRHRIS